MSTVSVCDQCHLLLSRAGASKRKVVHAGDNKKSFALDMQTTATILKRLENLPNNGIFAKAKENGYRVLSEEYTRQLETVERIKKVRKKMVDLMKFTIAQVSLYTNAGKREAFQKEYAESVKILNIGLEQRLLEDKENVSNVEQATPKLVELVQNWIENFEAETEDNSQTMAFTNDFSSSSSVLQLSAQENEIPKTGDLAEWHK